MKAASFRGELAGEGRRTWGGTKKKQKSRRRSDKCVLERSVSLLRATTQAAAFVLGLAGRDPKPAKPSQRPINTRQEEDGLRT